MAEGDTPRTMVAGSESGAITRRASTPATTATPPAATCPLCFEDIKAGALVCKHCRSNLGPLHGLMAERSALGARVAALETELASLRDGGAAPAAIAEPPPRFGWPHMVDNLFLGLATMLAVHWLAGTLPETHRGVYRLIALGIALPFGFRYEIYARAGASLQVLAALVFGLLSTLLIGVLDTALGVAGPLAATAVGRDAAASVALIALSHFTGSSVAQWTRRGERKSKAAGLQAGLGALATVFMVMRKAEPEKIKGRIDAIHGLLETAAPVAAAAATAWAAFGKTLFQ